ncbi:erythromycin esterase [Opitutaceae bacterium EW11]|nr:erythromycin esterase [Opitutaceae bacterium EW11]
MPFSSEFSFRSERDRLRQGARTFPGLAEEARWISDWLGDAKVVLLGEASHGTHEFYELRAEITRNLIERHRFSAVAIEGDWPDAYQVHRYITREGVAGSAESALGGFARFPQWMWRNTVVRDFVGWLRARNLSVGAAQDRTDFFGLDLYSLRSSMQAVVAYLEKVDPEAARAAKASYGCFEDFGQETESYAWASKHLGEGLCEDVVVRELLALRSRRAEYVEADGHAAHEEFFSAEQNARVARNAEEYYRTMLHGRVASWNIRDRHMAETLDQLMEHLRRRGLPQKIAVWAHNSHLGDARATEVAKEGELNLGQLVRERYGETAKLLGFTTYTGAVTAASDWDAPAQHKRVRAALPHSYEELLHELNLPRFFLPLRGPGAVGRNLLPEWHLERAIGVIYRPETERWSHYFHCNLANQFDAVMHIDRTTALEPLERTPLWESGRVPETFPSGV